MERFLILRLGAMGDVLHALPAVAALRRFAPTATIDWLIEPRWSGLVDPALATTIAAPTKEWRQRLLSASTWRAIGALRRRLRGAGYRQAIDMQGAVKSAVLGVMAGAEVTGFTHPRERPARWTYFRDVQPTAEHVIEQNLTLAWVVARELGTGEPSFVEFSQVDPLRPAPDRLPRDPEAEAWAGAQLGDASDVAILNPGAGWRAKEWPPEKYGELARQLGTLGISSRVNIGPGDHEGALVSAVEAASGGHARRVVASIPQLVSLTRRARLFVGGDTGPMHLANALGVPVVALFGPTDPARNGPYFQPYTVLRSPRSGTSYSHRNAIDPGLAAIEVKTVTEAAVKLMKK